MNNNCTLYEQDLFHIVPFSYISNIAVNGSILRMYSRFCLGTFLEGLEAFHMDIQRKYEFPEGIASVYLGNPI